MMRNWRPVEAGVLALALAGCVTPEPESPYGRNVPDGIDYTMAVQCSGLLSAYRFLGGEESMRLYSESRIFQIWAVTRAKEGGRDEILANFNIDQSAADFRRISGDGPKEERLKRLEAVHGSDISTCRSLAKLADFDIVVFGG